jgi:excisionase family DNA binding protein
MSTSETHLSTQVEDSLWTTGEVAVFLRCSRSYVYKAAERDAIPSFRIGRMLRFSPERVREFARGATRPGGGSHVQ